MNLRAPESVGNKLSDRLKVPIAYFIIKRSIRSLRDDIVAILRSLSAVRLTPNARFSHITKFLIFLHPKEEFASQLSRLKRMYDV